LDALVARLWAWYCVLADTLFIKERTMDTEEVKRAAKTMENIARAQAWTAQLDHRGDHPVTKIQEASVVHDKAMDASTAKMEAMSPTFKERYGPQYHRRMTAEEIENISEEVRQDNANKIWHNTAFGSHSADCECGLHPYPGRARFISKAEPLTASDLKDSHGPVGGETTPPFGKASRDEYWKGVANALKEEIKRLDGCIISWRDREEYLLAEVHKIRAELLEFRQVEERCETVELKNPLDLLKAERPLTPEELDRAVPVLTDYPLRKDPVESIAAAFGRAQTEKIDREILAQRDEMREQKANEDLKDALNEWQEIVAEEGPEVYGRGPLQGARVTMGVADDTVNSPAHYNTYGVECIDAIKLAVGEDGFRGYCHGNALKYLWRANYKADATEDLKKAAWYSRMATGDDPRDE
jgi:hypothetical protein